MLSGILYPSEGEITVASYVPYKQRKKYVSNIGVVLGQKSQLVWDLPVRDEMCIRDRNRCYLFKRYRVSDFFGKFQ